MKTIILFIISFSLLVQSGIAQQQPTDTTFGKSANYLGDGAIPDNSRTKLLPSLILPAALIGYGLTTLQNHGLYSSYQAKTDIQRAFGNQGAPIDNYLVFSPYVEFGALLLFKVNCKNDMVNTLLIIGKSEVLMLAIVEPLKYITKEERPDHSDDLSFPSGHTAEAFEAATIVYREFRYKSPWYGIGAYTLATTVGLYRMINNKHWESDVIVGAGIGILSANLVYATHLYRWGRKDYCFMPMYNGTSQGLMFTCTL
jgi:membrane-associated phospholipid phosphatase